MEILLFRYTNDYVHVTLSTLEILLLGYENS